MFVIDSFGKLSDSSLCLYLVVNGNEQHIKEIKEYISDQKKKDNIKLFSNREGIKGGARLWKDGVMP